MTLTTAVRSVLIHEAAGTLDPADTPETVAADPFLSEYVRGMADLIYRITGGSANGDDGVAQATAEILAAVPTFYAR